MRLYRSPLQYQRPFIHLWKERQSLVKGERVKSQVKSVTLTQTELSGTIRSRNVSSTSYPSSLHTCHTQASLGIFHKSKMQRLLSQTRYFEKWIRAKQNTARDLYSCSNPGAVTIVPLCEVECDASQQKFKSHNDRDIPPISSGGDAAWLASASEDRSIKIWDSGNGLCLKTLNGHDGAVNSVFFSHDSARLASASDDGTVKLWDTSSGRCQKTLEGHDDVVWSVDFSQDSTRLASASSDHTIRIWDTISGRRLKTLHGHNGAVGSVVFSHDSTRLATASWDNTVKIWDVSSGLCVKTLYGHNYAVDSVVFSHDSTRLATASWDGTVKIWDARTGCCLQTLEGHGHVVWSVVFSRD